MERFVDLLAARRLVKRGARICRNNVPLSCGGPGSRCGSHVQDTAEQAQLYFLQKRKQGVDAPSQKRYLHYLKHLMIGDFQFKLPVANLIRLSRVRIYGMPQAPASRIA